MKVYICNYDYWENDIGPVLRVMCRNINTHERIILDVQDERLDPVMYVLNDDFELVKNVCNEYNVWRYVKYCKHDCPKDEFDEKTVAIYTKYPREVKYIRDKLNGILTFQADVKWEKKVTQQLKWKLVLDIKDYDEYGFTPLDNITPCDDIVKTNFNICYWDIETDSSNTKGRQFADCRFAYKIPIITYAVYNRHKQHFLFYCWKEDWKEERYWEEHATELGERALSMAIFREYNTSIPVLVKKFSDEISMHREFINDFREGEYDGLMTFNGRGGNRVIATKGKHGRQWFTGFDFPMFCERCKHLGLWDEIQLLSPIPVGKDFKGKMNIQNIKLYIRYDDKKFETGREYIIKGVPQHDIFYDDNVLMYTKDHNKMKRRNLETFLNYFLGFGKIKHSESVWELYYKDWNKEKRYNIVDVEGLYALDIFFGYTDDVALRALAYGGKIEDGVYASKLHDHIKLWKISGEYLLPSRPEYGKETARDEQWSGLRELMLDIGIIEPGKKKAGGFNLDVTPGIYGYNDRLIGFILDFAKLYPSCSRSVNADTRSKLNLRRIIIDENGINYEDTMNRLYGWNDVTRNPAGFFRKDVVAIDTIIYNELIGMRSKLKKEMVRYYILANETDDVNLKEEYTNMAKTYNAMQFSYKGLINGKFGATGMGGDRSFDYVVYNTPPATGQILIQKVIQHMDKRGYPAIFASTDSVMSIAKSIDPHVAWSEIQGLVSDINAVLDVWQREQFNVIENYNSIGCEKIFRPWILFDKRRYACSVIMEEDAGKIIEYKEPKPYWKGLERVRRNTADFTYELQDTVMNMLFKGEEEDVIFDYLRDLYSTFDKNKWEFVCKKCGISKSIDEANSQSYVACRNANKFMGKNYDAGSTPYLGIFAEGGYPKTLDGKYLKTDKEDGEFVMAFDENDEWEMRKLGFRLDYEIYKRKVFIDVIEPLLELVFNRKFHEIVIDKRSLWEI